jgi:hypothetical protein
MNGEDTPKEAPSRTAGLMPPWQPGQSGNPAGRPKGARSKLSEDFFRALQEDFEQHGAASIIAMRCERPGDYAKMIAALQTKELSGEGGETLGFVVFKGLNDGG